MMRRSFIVFMVFVPCLLLETKGKVGSELCGQCHEEPYAFFQSTAHAHPFFLGEKGGGCEACHGPGAKHGDTNEAKDIRGPKLLKAWTVEEKSQACLSCHKRNLTQWHVSSHNGVVSCWDCHQEMLHFVKGGKRQSCENCHKNIALRMKQQYAHKQSCIACHNPHDALPVDRQVNDLCFQCHTEYRGPFLYEHGALDDGCTVCHNPHATATRRLLKMTGNGLCLQCHAQYDFTAIGNTVHASMLEGGAFCYDCHIQIHGSNTDPNFNPRLR